MRRNDVASTSFRRRVPIRFLINQCQIITFLILKYDIIENSRIELRGIVLPVQMGGLLGGQRVCWPPSQIIGGGLAPPAPPPSSYAYALYEFRVAPPLYFKRSMAFSVCHAPLDLQVRRRHSSVAMAALEFSAVVPSTLDNK